MQRTQKEKKWSRLKKHEIAKRHQKKKLCSPWKQIKCISHTYSR